MGAQLTPVMALHSRMLFLVACLCSGALSIMESDFQSGTALELSRTLQEAHKGEKEEWKNNHRCWCSTDGSNTDEQEKLSDERGKKKIIAKLERWNKEHSVANQQKIAAAQAKMQAEEEAQKDEAM